MKYILEFLFKFLIAFIFIAGARCGSDNIILMYVCYFLGFMLIDGYVVFANKIKNEKY